MSEAALKERGVSKSIAQEISTEIGLTHDLSDPSPDLRKQLGIRSESELRLEGFFGEWDDTVVEAEISRSHQMRERHWLERLRALDSWPVVFVCGANHCDSFATILRENKIEVTVAYKDWEPNRLIQ